LSGCRCSGRDTSHDRTLRQRHGLFLDALHTKCGNYHFPNTRRRRTQPYFSAKEGDPRAATRRFVAESPTFASDILCKVDDSQTTLQALWASGVRFTLRYEGGAWSVRVGDYRAGLGVEARLRTFEEAVAFVENTVRSGTETPGRTH